MNKPCPFCGCKRSRIQLYEDSVFRVCIKCRCGTRACETKAEATKVWNTRAEKGD